MIATGGWMGAKPLNILLVEDDEVDVMTVRRAFRDVGVRHSLHVAENGEEALSMLRAGNCPSDNCLVLLDLNMPHMDGHEFLQRLRDDPELHRTPVVVLTSSNREQDRLQAYDRNVAGYLLKPPTFPRFLELAATLDHYWSEVEMPPSA